MRRHNDLEIAKMYIVTEIFDKKSYRLKLKKTKNFLAHRDCFSNLFFVYYKNEKYFSQFFCFFI